MTKARTNADNVAGDISGVTAGTGLTGGGTSGTVTLTNDMATTINAAGDLIYGTGNDAYTRLALGTAGHYLKVNSGATAPEWADVSAGANWSLVNTGGTALTGATTITVSGISNADKIMVLVAGASSVNQSTFGIRVNADSGSNYNSYGATQVWGSAYNPANYDDWTQGGTTSIVIGRTSTTATSICSGYVLFSGCNSSGAKIFNSAGGADDAGDNTHRHIQTGGWYSGSSTISSVSVVSSSGNFDAGTVFVYTSA